MTWIFIAAFVTVFVILLAVAIVVGDALDAWAELREDWHGWE